MFGVANNPNFGGGYIFQLAATRSNMYILITHVPGYMCVYDTDTGTTGTQILLSIFFSFPHSFALRHTRTQWQ